MAFLAAAAPVLARDEALASSYVAFANGLLRNPPTASESVYLATYAAAGSQGAAMMRGLGGLWVGASDVAAAAAFADDVFLQHAAAQSVPRGVVGLRPACDAFADRWRTLTGRTHVMRVQLRNHKLTRVDAVPRLGVARLATPPTSMGGRCGTISSWSPSAGRCRALRALIPRRIEQGQIWIWDDDGAVAFAGWTDAPPDAARIAPVYTPPRARGRGYATALVAELSQALLDQGRQGLFLITDLANPISNAIPAQRSASVQNRTCFTSASSTCGGS
jgi:predicted GNAT family acetyltransferase